MTRNKNSHINIGPLTKGGAGRHAPLHREFLPTPTRLTNATAGRGLYVRPKVFVRAGADDNLNYRSLKT